MRSAQLSRACRGRRPPGFRGGQALVEFALVLPILLLLFLGVVEFGRAWMIRQVVTNAARSGARSGIVLGASESDVHATVNHYLESADLTGSAVVLTGGVGPSVPVGTATWVEVQYRMEAISGGFIPGWSGVINLTHRATMRHE